MCLCYFFFWFLFGSLCVYLCVLCSISPFFTTRARAHVLQLNFIALHGKREDFILNLVRRKQKHGQTLQKKWKRITGANFLYRAMFLLLNAADTYLCNQQLTYFRFIFIFFFLHAVALLPFRARTHKHQPKRVIQCAVRRWNGARVSRLNIKCNVSGWTRSGSLMHGPKSRQVQSK